VPRTLKIVVAIAGSVGAVALVIHLLAPAPHYEPRIVGADGAPMMLVPAGRFSMGGDDDEQDERPVHAVHLDAFYMDRYEVTIARYAKFRSASPRAAPFKWEEADLRADGERPVTGVSWEDARDYCESAGKRLPSEAEWEKAARGTDGRRYPWGSSDPTSAHGNFDQCCKWIGYATLAVVGSFEKGRSPYGIDDMATNLSEWTADWYGKDYYKNSPALNPKGPSVAEEKGASLFGNFDHRVVRGGSWTSGPKALRTTFRAHSRPTFRHGNVGFRCAVSAAVVGGRLAK
jgi:formylglycine-generating enzyme